MEIRLSDFGQKSTIPSPVNKLTESFASDFREGFDINLGVGYVNDKTIPNELIKKALDEVLSDTRKYRNAMNYGGAQGSPNMINSIKEYYLRNNIGGLNAKIWDNHKVLIGANGATSLLEAFADVVAPGVVITSDPYYYIYCETLVRKGFEVVSVPEDKDGILIDELQSTLSNVDKSRLSFFYFVTVNNPSCSILSNARRKEIVEIVSDLCRNENRLIPIIFDRAYEDIAHSDQIEPMTSGLKFDTMQMVFETGTMSKILAPALRVGYMICPDCEFTNLLIQKTSDIGFSAPLINQEISSWILDHCIEQQLQKVRNGYREKAEVIRKYFYERLGNELEELIGGDAGFYFYVTLRNVETHEKSLFNAYLYRCTGDNSADGFPTKKERLVLIPGTCCVNPSGKIVDKGRRQFRLSYGFEETERIIKAIDIIAEAVEYVKSKQ